MHFIYFSFTSLEQIVAFFSYFHFRNQDSERLCSCYAIGLRARRTLFINVLLFFVCGHFHIVCNIISLKIVGEAEKKVASMAASPASCNNSKRNTQVTRRKSRCSLYEMIGTPTI